MVTNPSQVPEVSASAWPSPGCFVRTTLSVMATHAVCLLPRTRRATAVPSAPVSIKAARTENHQITRWQFPPHYTCGNRFTDSGSSIAAGPGRC
jgi:hypothetical protein